jgi:hypothetical protein
VVPLVSTLYRIIHESWNHENHENHENQFESIRINSNHENHPDDDEWAGSFLVFDLTSTVNLLLETPRFFGVAEVAGVRFGGGTPLALRIRVLSRHRLAKAVAAMFSATA